ncbi:YfkD famly protein [Oceanobacillus manasiensis]|uniref:YfkD famly protein n=1 Tax=Oceanobacillus manasiensis TaxID=586413 RepID=UPI0005A6A0EA|nr:YfkD famly protein [Oceanobacillus manasiensis]
MKKRNVGFLLITVLVFTFLFPVSSFSKEKKDDFEIPSHVLTISKENTFPNATEDQEVIEPSDLTKELMDGLKMKIENPDLIKLLNESNIKPSPIALGYRGMVFIGRWPLNYESLETTINWEYQPINKNEINNLGGETAQEMNYVQQEQREVKGALTNKIANPDDIKKMMLIKSKEKTKLPLAYHTVIGENTKKDNSYAVPAEKHATLNSYAPAVNEKGQVTFGEVYIELKGSKKSIVVKNVTKQGIGAWIPIQDHVSFSYNVK